MVTRHERRKLFDTVAPLYQKARPGYPPEILDALLPLMGRETPGRALEVGSGTGQFTRPLAARGWDILALEPGAQLAELTRAHCALLPNVQVAHTTFESWGGQSEAFDLVAAAQSFHWIEPVLGCQLAYQALRPGGWLALVWTIDCSQDTPFWKRTDPLYKRWMSPPPDADRSPRKEPQTLRKHHDRYAQLLEQSPQFGNSKRFAHSWSKTYRTEAWISLIHTFSDHIALPVAKREALSADIARVIEDMGGSIERFYRTVLLVSQRA